MPPKLNINIGPKGFTGPGDKPKYKVKKNQLVEFKLVGGASPVDVYFSSGSPFATERIPVGDSGSGDLQATVEGAFRMEVQPPSDEEPSLKVMEGKTGELDVDPP